MKTFELTIQKDSEVQYTLKSKHFDIVVQHDQGNASIIHHVVLWGGNTSFYHHKIGDMFIVDKQGDVSVYGASLHGQISILIDNSQNLSLSYHINGETIGNLGEYTPTKTLIAIFKIIKHPSD